MNKRIKIMILIIILLSISLVVIIYNRKNNTPNTDPVISTSKKEKTSFDFKVIGETNNLIKNENYLISPLSIGYALSLLNEGANENTKNEIDNVLDNYKLPNIKNIEKRIAIANLLFIKNSYKDDINDSFINTLQNKYYSDLLIDEFNNPDKANEWISDKTYKMINHAIDDLGQDFVLGLANTIAIDVEWKNKFSCCKTNNGEFTKIDNTKMNAAYMKGEDDGYYLETENAKGIIKEYMIYDTKTNKESREENENTVSLEYIAILPNNNINDYLKSFNEKEFKSLIDSKKANNEDFTFYYYLPKYTYDYSYESFKEMLINLGIKDAFNSEKASFKNMVNKDSLLKLYVSKAIHKTHIELSENGTKAAAVTAFMMEKNAMILDDNIVKLEFNRPFIYIIKEKNSDNIWFFGVVHEPMKWENNNGCN